MIRSSSLKDKLRAVKPSRRATAIECRHSYNRSRDSGISGLARPLSCNETPNNFGEDADQFVLRRRDSAGAELYTKYQLSRSLSLDCDELAPLRRAPSPYKLRSNFNDRLQTYYPLHQGPSITVSSADGTTLCANSESDTQRNAAAQSLFRALTRQFTEERLKTLDSHMDKILGTVELDLEIKHINALTGVDVSDYEWEIQSMHAIIEGNNERKIRKQVQKVKDMWNKWVAKIFGRRKLIHAAA